ncbi:MAG TPA: ATP-binding protein, partial [Streptomyces sp.]
MTAPGHPAEDLNLRHLLARAVGVEQRIRHAVEARRCTDPDPDDAFRGLYLTDENIARLLDVEGARGFPEPMGTDTAPAADGDSRLASLEARFGLTALDTEILLIALVPDLDERFEAFYGYLNDDVTRRRPSIGLALGLCGLSPADAVARGRLAARAPLRHAGLLLAEDLDRPFLSRALRVPDRVTAHLLGDDTRDPRLAGLLAPWHAVEGVGDPAPLARVLADGLPLAYLSEDQGGAGTALAASA